jgi:hypothetical protein
LPAAAPVRYLHRNPDYGRQRIRTSQSLMTKKRYVIIAVAVIAIIVILAFVRF